MRAFHVSWVSFFFCFFSWFGVAPLMAIIRDEFGLTKTQVGNTIIASVAATVFARLVIGSACDRYGPRKTYSALLVIGSIPVFLMALSTGYHSFLILRLLVGCIGASFVITQYHTSMMFAPNVIGTANATTAGWGNMGGGATQFLLPLVFAMFMGFGFSESMSWRLCMVVAGCICCLLGVIYYNFTQDTPTGNLSDLKHGQDDGVVEVKPGFLAAAGDYRVWLLFIGYGACFGLTLTFNNIAALYFNDFFGLSLKTAGLVAALYGGMNIFARSLGGFISDKLGMKWGLKGRVKFLMGMLFIEGLLLMVFSRVTIFPLAIVSMIALAISVQMSEGATFSVVPFVNQKAMGSVAGIVGSGGNVGAILAGFLLREESIAWPDALFILGLIVSILAFVVGGVRFSNQTESEVASQVQRGDSALVGSGA
ncbi:MAG: MFS transporter [Myxococcota bacterium]|nr:MFS transporter [Myxococcota bacterium]